jgi:hypothetical protein
MPLRNSSLRLFALAALVTVPARATDYHVSPTAAAGGDGSQARPFRTVEEGQTAASPGDTVLIHDGVFTFTGTSRTVGVAFTKSGQADRRINYFAAPGEHPVFDLTNLTPQARVTGLDVNCSYVHLRGLEVRGVQQIIVGDSWSVRIRGGNNILETLNVHHGEAPGIFIASGAGNVVLNCDSHDNYDPLEGGGNADGFGCHSTGAGNVFRGCRGYSNSDDGFDFINAPGACTVEASWAFRNGYVPGTTTNAGNGAGFKAGGFGSPPSIPASGVPRHVIRFNVAFRNRSQGFYANHHPGGLDFLNNTAFANATNFDMLVEGGTSTHKLQNNVAMGGTAVARFTGGTNTFNSWTLPVTVSAADFASILEDEALAPRQADGSLPNTKLLRLAPDSDLIDKGTDLGFPYGGAAPDLGAFESGAPLGTGGGGAGGAGGGGQPGTGGVAMGGAASTGGVAGSGGAANPASGGAGVTGGAAGAGAGGMPAGGVAAGTGGVAAGTGGIGASSGGGTMNGQGGVGGSVVDSPSPEDESGCNCRTVGRPKHAAAFSMSRSLALAALALASVSRRRRHRPLLPRFYGERPEKPRTKRPPPGHLC